MITSNSLEPFQTYAPQIEARVDNGTFAFMKPEMFESLNPEPNNLIVMNIELQSQWEWVQKQIGKEGMDSTPTMVSDQPGDNPKYRYLELYYPTRSSDTFIKVAFTNDQPDQPVEYWKTEAIKFSPEKLLEMQQTYGVK